MAEKSYVPRFFTLLWRKSTPWARDNILVAGSMVILPAIALYIRDPNHPLDWGLIRTTGWLYLAVFVLYVIYRCVKTVLLLDQEKDEAISAANDKHSETASLMKARITVLETNITEELERKRQAKPNIRAEINLALRDRFSGLCLLHVHFVNSGDDPVTVKRIHLIHHQGDGKFVAILFGKRQIVKGREKRVSLVYNDGELAKKRESITTSEVIDILDSLRSSPLIKGHARIGWLAFEIPYFENEIDCPSLSLLVEDSLGELHYGPVSITPYEYGATFQ